MRPTDRFDGLGLPRCRSAVMSIWTTKSGIFTALNRHFKSFGKILVAKACLSRSRPRRKDHEYIGLHDCVYVGNFLRNYYGKIELLFACGGRYEVVLSGGRTIRFRASGEIIRHARPQYQPPDRGSMCMFLSYSMVNL